MNFALYRTKPYAVAGETTLLRSLLFVIPPLATRCKYEVAFNSNSGERPPRGSRARFVAFAYVKCSREMISVINLRLDELNRAQRMRRAEHEEREERRERARFFAHRARGPRFRLRRETSRCRLRPTGPGENRLAGLVNKLS